MKEVTCGDVFLEFTIASAINLHSIHWDNFVTVEIGRVGELENCGVV
jgi:hypothetical protein